MIIPPKLKKGDLVRVVAPSRSLAIVSKECIDVANERLINLGFRLSFGKYVSGKDDFASSSIEHRVSDLHDAFADKEVTAIFAVLGGFNCIQLLRYLDWDLIKKNPKIFCGYSDVTVLSNALLAKSGLVTYSGPHYSTFGQKLYFDYTLNCFQKCLMYEASFFVEPSLQWFDDEWYKNQDNRIPLVNEGYWVINEGQAEGVVIGGHLPALNSLQGTEFMPSLSNSLLFIECDCESQVHHFDRSLQSLIHLPEFSGVKGIVIGRFQKGSNVNRNLLKQVIKTKEELASLPAVANVDFGHTDPKITFPIGGQVKLEANNEKARIEIIKH